MTFYWLSKKEFHKKTASNTSLSVAQSTNCYNVLVNISKSTKVICFVFPVLDNLWVLYTHMHSDKLMLVYWFILACVLKTWLHLFGNVTLPWPAAEINTKLQAALLRLGQNISSFLSSSLVIVWPYRDIFNPRDEASIWRSHRSLWKHYLIYGFCQSCYNSCWHYRHIYMICIFLLPH